MDGLRPENRVVPPIFSMKSTRKGNSIRSLSEVFLQTVPIFHPHIRAAREFMPDQP
jgi:hypothetical protein